jgi:nucleotide-binding universal stress UspA family protein
MRQRLEALAQRTFLPSAQRANFAEAEVKIVCGDPAEQILQEAQKGGYELVVMGTHGHGRLLGMVLGQRRPADDQEQQDSGSRGPIA